MQQTANASTTFKRTPVTFTVYSIMAFFGMSMAVPGAIMPFIGDRLGLTYGQIGLHFTVTGAGSLLIGLYGDRLSARFGNHLVSWLSGIITVAALFMLVTGNSMMVTLPALFFYGAAAISAGQFVTAAVADEHPEHNTQVLSEANIVAGTGVAIGPLLVGLLERSGVGWTAIAFVMAVLWALLMAIFARFDFPDQRKPKTGGAVTKSSTLPTLFWIICAIVFLSVSIEWLLFYWSPDFLATVVGFEQSTASALISVQAIAMVIGRLAGRRLLNWMSPGRLLIFAYLWILLWLPVYLFSPFPIFNIVGLFGLGLGIANLFPLTLSGAMTAGGEQTGRASARVTVFASSATLIMPKIVGNIADVITIRPAMLTIAALAMIGIGVTLLANRAKHTSPTPHAL